MNASAKCDCDGFPSLERPTAGENLSAGAVAADSLFGQNIWPKVSGLWSRAAQTWQVPLILNGFSTRTARLVDAEAIARVHVTAWRETYSGIIAEQYLGYFPVKWFNLTRKHPKGADRRKPHGDVAFGLIPQDAGQCFLDRRG